MATAPKTTTDTSVSALSAALAAPPVEKDEFADAFAGFTADPQPTTAQAEPPAKSAAEGADGAQTTTTDDEPQTELEVPEEGAEGGTEETPEAKAAREAAAAAAAKKKDPAEDAIARLADVLTQRQPPADKTTQQTQPPAAPQPVYSAEEVAQIQNFYKEWPEVAPAVEVILRGAITATENRIYAEVARVIGPKLKLLDQLADNAVYSQIKQAVPDYDDTLEDKVAAWVKTQPAYLQTAYTNVMQNGTADDITDLVKRFRQETGTAAPTGDRTTQQAQPDPAPARQAAPLSTVAKKAAAALAPVNSKRTGTTQVEPQSFDEAFEVFAKAG